MENNIEIILDLNPPEENRDPEISWDGSYLGKYDKSIIQWKLITQRATYVNLKLGVTEVTGSIKKVKSCIPCIIDELKPLFGCRKSGTHHFYLGKVLYMLTSAVVTEAGIQEDYRLDEFKTKTSKVSTFPDFLRYEVQKTYVFRTLIGLTSNFDRSLRVRIINNMVYILSFCENIINPEVNRNISQAVGKYWFFDTNSNEVLQKMFNVETTDDIHVVLYQLRSDIESVIKRINRDEIIYASKITEQVQNRLLQLQLPSVGTSVG